jgi:hypothetical protein
MALPKLTPEQQKAALEKAKEARTKRKELREQITAGKITAAEILDREGDPIVDKFKVKSLIEALPGYGKAKAEKLLEELGISDTRKIKGLGKNQRAALRERLS